MEKRNIEMGCIKTSEGYDMDEYKIIIWYYMRSVKILKETVRYMRVMWNSRQRHERLRDCELE